MRIALAITTLALGCQSDTVDDPEELQALLRDAPRSAFGESSLSGFLQGTTAFDPVTGQQRTFNDLARRNGDLTSIVCGDALTSRLRKGIQRVH